MRETYGSDMGIGGQDSEVYFAGDRVGTVVLKDVTR